LSWSISSIFQRKFTLKCTSQPKIAKNSLKTDIFGVQLRSYKVIDVGTPGKLVSSVMTRSKSVSICNRSHARLVDSSRNRTFSRGYPNLMRSYGGLLEPRGSKLALLKSRPTFNAECCLGLSLLISTQFTLEMCVAATNSEKSR